APILLAPSFDAKELRATCSQCPHGLTFGVFKHGLSTVSTPRLHCGHAATLVQGFTERCDCKAHQVHDQQFSDQVQVSQTRSYCVDCPRHHEDHEDECRKCPMHKAWSDGAGQPCRFWPDAGAVRVLVLAALAFVLLGFTAFEIVWAPLAIVDAQALEGKGFVITGPISRLPKFLASYVNRNMTYRIQDTGLPWLDNPKVGNIAFKSLGRGKWQLPPQLQPPFACATSRGFLTARGYGSLLLQLWLLLFALILLPTALAVAASYENDGLHVLVTLGCFALPLAFFAALLHPLAAYLLRRERTPLQDACLEYLRALPKIDTADAAKSHPKDQGLALSILWEFWEHFERFILQNLGDHIMDSAFARVLQSGVRGVWCLFEFLLSSQLNLDLVFGTDLGVLGEQGTSPDITLEIGRKLETLQVANCHASSAEDKRKIFDFICAELGSIEHMDKQIKKRMSRILRQN
ncbi:unnamed protein product, partial [Symbiodinium pilosum]